MEKYRRSLTTITRLTIALVLAGASSLQAEIYQFISPDGVIHFTNVPTDPRYRRLAPDKHFLLGLSHVDIPQTILFAARQYNVDPDLIKAVIKVESDFDPQAVSRAGAMGLMQLMPATVTTLNVRDPFNPQENIAAGVRYLSGLLDRFDGILTLALAAYHAGEARVKRYGKVPPIEQTHRYIQKVMAAYAVYQRGDKGRRKIYKVLTPPDQVIYTNDPAPYQDAERFDVSHGK